MTNPTRLVAAHLIVAVVALATGCHPHRAQYEAIAQEANPILDALKPAATAILGSNADPKTIVTACRGANGHLSQLQALNIREGGDYQHEPLSFYTGFAGGTVAACGAIADEDDMNGCVSWCKDAWTSLAREVKRLHVAAMEDGVEITSWVP